MTTTGRLEPGVYDRRRGFGIDLVISDEYGIIEPDECSSRWQIYIDGLLEHDSRSPNCGGFYTSGPLKAAGAYRVHVTIWSTSDQKGMTDVKFKVIDTN